MCVQRAVLYAGPFGEVGKRAGFAKTIPYFLKTAALLVGALVISLPVFMFLPSQIGVSASVLIFASATLIVYALVLSLLGTWPTSSITGLGTSLVDALRRGNSSIFPNVRSAHRGDHFAGGPFDAAHRGCVPVCDLAIAVGRWKTEHPYPRRLGDCCIPSGSWRELCRGCSCPRLHFRGAGL